MGAENSGALQSQTSVQVANAQATTPQAAAAPQANGPVTGSTKIASLNDLKEKAPKVWNMMMQGIGMTMCKQMEKGQARIKAAMRKAQQDSTR